MREFKFRAWDREEKKYIFDNVQFACSCIDLSCDGFRDFIGFGEPEAERFDMEQFTGLKDKNGVEIYEGDLLRLRDTYNNLWAKGRAEVVFSHGYVGGWVLQSPENKEDVVNIGTRTEHVEVCGNIHEEKP